MLTQYINKYIFKPNGADSAIRFTSLQEGLLVKSLDIKTYNQNSVELHVYSNENWITGNHRSVISHTVPLNTKLTDFNGTPIVIDIFNEFNKLKLTAGQFRFVINFFTDIIGSYEQPLLYIDEISSDRTEARLKIINSDVTGKVQLANYSKIVPQTDNILHPYYTQYLLNFSQNKTIAYVNSVVVGEYLYVKFLDRLPEEFIVNLKCWVVKEEKLPYTDLISLLPIEVKRVFNTLSSPNWDANVSNLNISSETDIKNWNDLLGSSVQTSQQIVDKYFSGSLSGTPLNIDFRDFNNFIFYSSATERVNNFKFKLELLEYYNTQISILNTITGSTATTNATDYLTNKTNLISGFDAFEKYLYFESSSLITTTDIPVLNATVSRLTGSYVFPIPKSNDTVPYTSYSTTSSLFINWYNTLIESASLYDSLNLNKLSNALPDAIKYNDDNIQVVTFVNMLGHHYDILHSYIKQASNIYKHEENPKIGIPNELLYSVAKQFGWNLSEGNQYHELWQYTLGLNESGAPMTGSLSVGDPSVSSQNMTHHVWRRIVNNLPLLLKSKGTKRSVQALLSCYGIPQSMISINEYGGPRMERVPVYEKLNFDYALDLITNTAGTVTVPWNASGSAVEIRFRTDDVVTNPNIPSNMNLLTVGSNVVTLAFTSGNKGKVKINGTGSADIELFDGNWLNLILQQNGTNLDLFVKKAKYGKIVASVSASCTGSLSTPGSLQIGTSISASRLIGELQELRIWSGGLSTSAFENHTKAPSSYNGNTDAFHELYFRLPLTQKINHSTTSSLTGAEPNPSYITATFASWSTNEPYNSVEETYYFDGISLALGTYDDNKVRLESSSLESNRLQLLKRVELSEYDQAPLDSNKLGIYFSPQTMIDEDIIAQLGFTELDSYIGDPGDAEKHYYPELKQVARNYWKKYSDVNDFNAYIKIFSMFDMSFFKQLDQLLPARIEKLTGLLIQPNILERNKDSILPTISRTYDDLHFEITASYNEFVTGEYSLYDMELLKNDNYEFNADFSETYNYYLTASNSQKYNGTRYTYNYLIKSGSVYITGSTPYWLSDGVINAITGSKLSEFLLKTEIFTSGGIDYKIKTPATVTDYNSMAMMNSKYNGCKMTSPGFNIPSLDTYNGKPVVEIIEVNPTKVNLNPIKSAVPSIAPIINNFNNISPNWE